MSRHLSTERIHDLLDGLLPPEEVGVARGHLDTCARCREELDALTRLVSDMRALPEEAKAPEEAWEGVEARLSHPASVGAERAAPDDARVLPFPAERTTRRRRIAFTVPQLAAAAAVVALLSAGTVWMALSGRAQGTVPVQAAAPVEGLGPAARMAASGGAAYDQALLELQTIVDRGRHVLAPETMQALDRSLATIDEAIADIRQALDKDPSSQILIRMLINQQRTKLRVLRQAATAMQSRS